MVAGARQAGEIRERVESEIYFSRRAAIFVAANFLEEISGQLALFDEFQEGEIGVHARGNHVRVNFFAAFEHHALGFAILDEDAFDGSFLADFDPGFEGCVTYGV